MNEKRDNRDPLFRAAEEVTDAALTFASNMASGSRRKRRELDEAEARADMEAENEMAERALDRLERAAERGDREEAAKAYNRFRSLQNDLYNLRLDDRARQELRRRELAATRSLIRLRERLRERSPRRDERDRRERERKERR